MTYKDLPKFPSLKVRIDAAQGKIPCDLVLKNVNYLDVFTCQWRKGEISVADGVIVGIESGLKAKKTIDARGQWLVPGFIDAHVHIESSMMTPQPFQDAILKKGTTSAVCDPHELANVLGLEGIEYFLNSAETLEMDLWVMLSSCVPATHMETNGGGNISAQQLAPLANHPRTLGLAEMMNVPGVLHGDPDILDKLYLFGDRPKDGHCPLVRGQALSAYASVGISSCHESSELEEAREKLTKGISVWIREGSVAKDLKTIAPLLNLATSTSMGFCTDDRNPYDIAEEGHIDHLIRESIRLGIAPEVVYRTASWSVARHYGLTDRLRRVGAIAPGYQADLVLLGDAKSCSIVDVFKNGRSFDSIETAPRGKLQLGNSIRATLPQEADLEGPSGRVHVIGILEGKIISEHRVKDANSRGVAKLTVLERYGKGSRPANAYVEGFGENLNGAIASSVGHDSHNLIVVGSNTRDMRVALAALAQSGGGFCVVQNGSVISHLPLPLGGLMSEAGPEDLKKSISSLKQSGRQIGCSLTEPFLQLAFLSLPVIPSLKLTDRGLVDVEKFQIIDVRAV